MTPGEFWDACMAFDWFYEYSDDHRVYRNGHDREAELLKEAKPGSMNRIIWNEFSQHHFHGGPRPDRPIEASAAAAPC